MTKCNACGRYASQVDGIKCSKCALFYHKACGATSQDSNAVGSWVCPGCKALTPRRDNASVSVGEPAVHASAQVCAGLDAEVLNELKLIRSDMQSFRGEFGCLREEMTAIRSAVEGFGGRIDALESRVERLEAKCAELEVKSSDNSLLSTIDQLKAQINERDQELCSNDLEIACIPEEPGENVAHLVRVVADKLAVPLEERDLVRVERVGVRRTPDVGEEAASAPRPRPILVRLVRRQLRDALLQGARVRREATTADLGLNAPPVKFFVNERLSKHNRALFFKVRKEAGTRGWRYVWTKDGRIFVRQDTGKAAVRVRSESELKQVFGM